MPVRNGESIEFPGGLFPPTMLGKATAARKPERFGRLRCFVKRRHDPITVIEAIDRLSASLVPVTWAIGISGTITKARRECRRCGRTL